MGSRGVFTTGVIDCEKCFSTLKNALEQADGIRDLTIHSMRTSGISKSSYSYGITANIHDIANKIGEDLCHPVTIGVIDDENHGEWIDINSPKLT